jgi:hypothetical protein
MTTEFLFEFSLLGLVDFGFLTGGLSMNSNLNLKAAKNML